MSAAENSPNKNAKNKFKTIKFPIINTNKNYKEEV